MAGLKMIVTKAGRAALVNAESDGTQAVTVVAAGVTAQAFVPDADMTALPGESKRLVTISGGATALDTIHVTIRDDGGDAYDVRGIGLYLDDGTLFALYGQANILIQKSAQATMQLAADVQFSDIDATQLVFGDTNFQLNMATKDMPGVVQLAALQDVLDGAEGESVITLTTLLKALLAHPRYAPGQIVWTAGRRAIPGTLLCNGSAVSRIDYANLFAEIGTTYGTGDGATTFNLPMLNDDVTVVHISDADKVGTFTPGAVITHIHSAISSTIGDHLHAITVNAGGDHDHNASTGAVGDHEHWAWTDAQGYHTHNISTDVQGNHAHYTPSWNFGAQGGSLSGTMNSGGAPNTNVPTNATGAHAHGGGTDGQGSHGHNIGMNGAGAHAHTVSVAVGGNHAHTASSQVAGGHAHNITVNATGNPYNLAAGLRMMACIAY